MIDWGRVTELRDEIGSDAFGEVVGLFVEEMEGVTQRLQTQTVHAKLADDLHFLKGSALNLGFRQFAALCTADEKREHEHGSNTVDIVALIDCYMRSKEQFLARAKDMMIAA